MYYDDLESHRIEAGLRIKELADLAGVDRTTITRIERHHKSSAETLSKVVTALNDAYFEKRGKTLNPQIVITQKSRFGGS